VGSSNIQNNFALKLTYMCLDNHGWMAYGNYQLELCQFSLFKNNFLPKIKICKLKNRIKLMKQIRQNLRMNYKLFIDIMSNELLPTY
jgi:hypothetical protein